MLEHVREIWNALQTVIRSVGVGVVVGLLLAFLIPTKIQIHDSSLCRPISNPAPGIAMMASLLGRLGGGSGSSGGSSGGIGGLAGDLFGLKTSGDLYIGVLQSRNCAGRSDHQV